MPAYPEAIELFDKSTSTPPTESVSPRSTVWGRVTARGVRDEGVVRVIVADTESDASADVVEALQVVTRAGQVASPTGSNFVFVRWKGRTRWLRLASIDRGDREDTIDCQRVFS